MTRIAARNENSVQASLAELRRLEVARIEAEKEAEVKKRIDPELRRTDAERQRAREVEEAEARRLAAERELELAKEKARLDAEARVQEKRLELEIKQAEAELARAQAAMPEKRGWAPLVIAAVLLLGVQGALAWHGARAVDRVAMQAQRQGERVDARLAEVELVVKNAAGAAQSAGTRVAELDGKVAALAQDRQVSGVQPTPGRAGATPAPNRPRPPRPEPRPGVPDLRECARTPLGCLD